MYSLGGDWKFLAYICGLAAANQNFACSWCKCLRHERFDINKKWSLTDKSLRARDSHKIGKHAESKQHNCKTNLLFDFIPIDRVIIDTLHLFLRISDNVIKLLIRGLHRKDAIDKVSTFSNGFVEIGITSWLGMRNLLKNLELILNGKSIGTPRSWSTEILLDLKNSWF